MAGWLSGLFRRAPAPDTPDPAVKPEPEQPVEAPPAAESEQAEAGEQTETGEQAANGEHEEAAEEPPAPPEPGSAVSPDRLDHALARLRADTPEPPVSDEDPGEPDGSAAG